MKSTAKKTLSLLLTAVLMLGLLSVGALADNDPIAGLAGLGEFTPPETNGQENPLVVPETDPSVNPPAENQGGNAVNTQGTDPTPVPETVPDDGKLRIYTTDRGMHLTIDGTTGVEPAVPAERELQVYGKEDPGRGTFSGPAAGPETGLQLRTPEAEELYLDRLALEKELGFYSTDWMVLNLTDGEGFRRNLTGSYDVTVSGPAMEKYNTEGTVFALLTLHWDAEGRISDRDVSILSPTHTPSFSSWSFQTDSLSTLLIVVKTGRPLQEEEKTVTYTFMADGKALSSQTLKDGDELVRPEDPAMEGCRFDGWYVGETALFTDTDGDGAVDPVIVHVTEESKDVTVTAKFTEIPLVPQRVVFRVQPENAVITVFPAPTETNPEPNAVPPEEDGSWSLLPGEYVYSAAAQDYTPLFDQVLTVTPQADGADQTVELSLERKPAAIRADRQWKVYGEPDPELSYTLEGLPEDAVVTGALSREEGENVGTYAITQGTLRVEGYDDLQFIGADLVITKADAVVVKAPSPAGVPAEGDLPAA